VLHEGALRARIVGKLYAEQGNPGMGDALTSVIATLAAQGLTLSKTATVGGELHARAGDLAALNGERGMMASDAISALRLVAYP